MLRLIRIPVAVLVLGILWAILSDPLITLLFKHLSPERQDAYRSANDFVFVIIISIFLYIVIRGQQQKITRSEEEYRNLFESNPNPMWIYEVQTYKFIKVNNATISKYGYTREQFLKMTIFDVRSLYDREKVKKEVKKKSGGISYSGVWEHLKANGEIFKVSITSHLVDFNNKKCRMVMATDLTELLDKEQKLSDALEKLKNHNTILLDIAWSNSHELRKPLCSIINLVDLLQKSSDEDEKAEYLNYLSRSSAELDYVFIKSNERLERIGL